MVSGASRLVNGLVQLLLLAFGILAASALFELSAAVLADNPVNRLGWWAPWLGVVVFAVGIYLHLSAPARSLPWMLVIMLAAYAGQVAGAAAFGGLLSGFFGALAMTPLALWVETVRNGPPKLVTFLPGFWLLVPGAAGLIGVTELLGVDHQLGAQAIVDTLVTVMSIALGVLIGTAAYHTTDSGLARSPGRSDREVLRRRPLVVPPDAGWGAAHPLDPYRRRRDRSTGRRWSSDERGSRRHGDGVHAERPPGRVHRRRRDGRRRDLRPARLGRRGGRRGRLDLLPDRRRGRRAAGLLVRQVRRPLPVGGRAPRVRRPRLRQRARHRDHRLVDPRRQRHRDGHGRRLLRQLRQLGGGRRERGVGQGLRRRRGARHDDPQRPRVAGGGQSADRGRHRRHRDPDRVRRRHARQPRPGPPGVLRLPRDRRHRVERGPDVLRLPRVRRRHVHRQGPGRPGTAAASGAVPRARHRHRDLRRRRPRRVRHAHRRRR